MTQPTCEERIDEHFKNTMEDIRFFVVLLDANSLDELDKDQIKKLSDMGHDPEDFDFDDKYQLIDEYGLAFDFTTQQQGKDIAPHFVEMVDEWDYGYKEAAQESNEAIARWELSWGGPSDGFLIEYNYNGRFWEIENIIYYFHDWFDGAGKTLFSQDFDDVERVVEALVDFSCMVM